MTCKEAEQANGCQRMSCNEPFHALGNQYACWLARTPIPALQQPLPIPTVTLAELWGVHLR